MNTFEFMSYIGKFCNVIVVKLILNQRRMQQRLVLHQAHCPSITQRVGSINLAQKSIVPNRQHATKRHRCIITNGIRGIQDFDASFEFESKEVEEALLEFLNDPRFHLQVINECKLTNVKGLEFTGMMFQPIPWSPNTPKGMPKVGFTFFLVAAFFCDVIIQN